MNMLFSLLVSGHVIFALANAGVDPPAAKPCASVGSDRSPYHNQLSCDQTMANCASVCHAVGSQMASSSLCAGSNPTTVRCSCVDGSDHFDDVCRTIPDPYPYPPGGTFPCDPWLGPKECGGATTNYSSVCVIYDPSQPTCPHSGYCQARPSITAITYAGLPPVTVSDAINVDINGVYTLGDAHHGTSPIRPGDEGGLWYNLNLTKHGHSDYMAQVSQDGVNCDSTWQFLLVRLQTAYHTAEVYPLPFRQVVPIRQGFVNLPTDPCFNGVAYTDGNNTLPNVHCISSK